MKTPRLQSNWLPLVLAAALAGSTAAQDITMPGWEDDDLGLVGDLEAEIEAESRDYDQLKLTHFSEVHRWQGVAPIRRQAGEKKTPYGWKMTRKIPYPLRQFVSPLSSGAATTVIAVPEKRSYRVWLSYMGERNRPHPVTLAFSGATRARHTFGQKGLGSGDGKAIEKEGPFRFEDDIGRMSSHAGAVTIWEYVDMELERGSTTLSLTSADTRAQVDALFITASKSFNPSKSHVEGEGNIFKTYYRVRVVEASKGSDDRFGIKGVALGYHWRRIYKGADQPLWYGHLGSKDPQGFKGEEGATTIPVGQWTRWVDVTEDVMNGPWARGGGPWATGRFSFTGVTKGVAEVQMAWFPHEGAVLRSLRPGLLEGAAICMIPLETLSQPPVAGTNDTEGVWGVRMPETVERFETASDVHRRHFEWGEEALAELDLKEGHPTPRLIRLYSGCRAAPAARETAQRMLARLGLNDVGVHDPALLAELKQKEHHFIGANDSQYLCWTHDPLDPTAERNFEASLRTRAKKILAGRSGDDAPWVSLKMGDEIGAITGEAGVNGFETCRRAFLDYLRATLAADGRDASFLGVESLDEIRYRADLPEDPGLYERRLYYHCSRFKFVLTAMYYGQITRAAEKVFPKVHTYCNFSPHPPMFGQHMNHSDWFTLTRESGANQAWGEGWASGGSWGFVGHEVVGYYGAWVECAARSRGLPAGFYIVGTMGGADKKVFSLVARGLFDLQLYSWGPLYAGAEGSNFWSERKSTYAEVARGAYALGPADAIIYRGKREPRRVALLYNRSHEIWNGPAGGFQSDRLLQFMALSHAHIPTDIILEQDLTPENLGQYEVIYIQGYNLARRHIAALKTWVEAGGVLVGVAGTAMRDIYDTEMSEGADLFGATQRLAGESKGSWHPQQLPTHEPIDRLALSGSALTPEMAVDVIGVKCVLTPTTGTSVGTFADGSCGAVLRALGKGRTLLLGVQPGHIYKGKTEGSSRYTLARRPLITFAAEQMLDAPRVTYSEPQTEICLFEHDSGLAVTLNNFAYFLEPADRPTVLTVKTDRDIKEVTASLQGPLQWKREGDHIRVDLKAPHTVDAVILR